MSRDQVLGAGRRLLLTAARPSPTRVDALGGEDEAVAWLATKGVDAKLKVVEWKNTRRGSYFLPDSLARMAARALGLPEESGDLLRELGADRLFLDGLVSVWHP